MRAELQVTIFNCSTYGEKSLHYICGHRLHTVEAFHKLDGHIDTKEAEKEIQDYYNINIL